MPRLRLLRNPHCRERSNRTMLIAEFLRGRMPWVFYTRPELHPHWSHFFPFMLAAPQLRRPIAAKAALTGSYPNIMTARLTISWRRVLARPDLAAQPRRVFSIRWIRPPKSSADWRSTTIIAPWSIRRRGAATALFTGRMWPPTARSRRVRASLPAMNTSGSTEAAGETRT